MEIDQFRCLMGDRFTGKAPQNERRAHLLKLWLLLNLALIAALMSGYFTYHLAR